MKRLALLVAVAAFAVAAFATSSSNRSGGEDRVDHDDAPFVLVPPTRAHDLVDSFVTHDQRLDGEA